jgi:hypothetical protein
MRYALALCVLAMVGCGGSDSTGPAPEGAIAVHFDAASCGAGNAEVFIDNVSHGNHFWAEGQSRSWTVDIGTHVVGARSGALVWASQSVTVQANTTHNILFTC